MKRASDSVNSSEVNVKWYLVLMFAKMGKAWNVE